MDKLLRFSLSHLRFAGTFVGMLSIMAVWRQLDLKVGDN